MKDITAAQLQAWLGNDIDRDADELKAIILELANCEYTPFQLRKDVMAWDAENKA